MGCFVYQKKFPFCVLVFKLYFNCCFMCHFLVESRSTDFLSTSEARSDIRTLGHALHGDNGCQIQLLRVRGYCGTVDSQYYVLGGAQIHLHSWSRMVTMCARSSCCRVLWVLWICGTMGIAWTALQSQTARAKLITPYQLPLTSTVMKTDLSLFAIELYYFMLSPITCKQALMLR